MSRIRPSTGWARSIVALVFVLTLGAACNRIEVESTDPGIDTSSTEQTADGETSTTPVPTTAVPTTEAPATTAAPTTATPTTDVTESTTTEPGVGIGDPGDQGDDTMTELPYTGPSEAVLFALIGLTMLVVGRTILDLTGLLDRFPLRPREMPAR